MLDCTLRALPAANTERKRPQVSEQERISRRSPFVSRNGAAAQVLSAAGAHPARRQAVRGERAGSAAASGGARPGRHTASSAQSRSGFSRVQTRPRARKPSCVALVPAQYF